MQVARESPRFEEARHRADAPALLLRGDARERDIAPAPHEKDGVHRAAQSRRGRQRGQKAAMRAAARDAQRQADGDAP